MRRQGEALAVGGVGLSVVIVLVLRGMGLAEPSEKNRIRPVLVQSCLGRLPYGGEAAHGEQFRTPLRIPLTFHVRPTPVVRAAPSGTPCADVNMVRPRSPGRIGPGHDRLSGAPHTRRPFAGVHEVLTVGLRAGRVPGVGFPVSCST